MAISMDSSLGTIDTSTLQESFLLQTCKMVVVIKLTFGPLEAQHPDFTPKRTSFLGPSHHSSPQRLGIFSNISASTIIWSMKLLPVRRMTQRRWTPGAPPRRTCTGASPRRATRRDRARPLRRRRPSPRSVAAAE